MVGVIGEGGESELDGNASNVLRSGGVHLLAEVSHIDAQGTESLQGEQSRNEQT